MRGGDVRLLTRQSAVGWVTAPPTVINPKFFSIFTPPRNFAPFAHKPRSYISGSKRAHIAAVRFYEA
ncbi:MAG: hypothetical protein GY803_15605 [Chloroflexi bacterium]|nr:hypothetical protein [Chloroflexota bacterium]